MGRSRCLDVTGEGRGSATEEGARLVMRMELRPKGTFACCCPSWVASCTKKKSPNLAAIKEVLEGSGASAALPGA
jgi:iron only hydrogenase large subunit-like protein